MAGVVGCVVGYSGGLGVDPTYHNIQDYTEALLVEYNPDKLSFEDIMEAWSRMDYPWVPQKTQYRSAIFALNPNQIQRAQDFVQHLQEKANRKLYVDVEPVTQFFKGEEYHQNFLAKQRQSRTLTFY